VQQLQSNINDDAINEKSYNSRRGKRVTVVRSWRPLAKNLTANQLYAISY